MLQTIDVTGLPPETVRAVESLVGILRGKTTGDSTTPALSIFDLFGKATHLRSGDDIAKQIQEEQSAVFSLRVDRPASSRAATIRAIHQGRNPPSGQAGGRRSCRQLARPTARRLQCSSVEPILAAHPSFECRVSRDYFDSGGVLFDGRTSLPSARTTKVAH